MALNKDIKLFLYDTETTGLGRNDEVIQIAGILTDINFKVLEVVNEYCWTNVPISPVAQEKTGITREILYKRSKGVYFEEIREKRNLFKEDNVIHVAYNDNFDVRLINQTLQNNGIDPINFGTIISTIKRDLPKGRYRLCCMKLLSGTITGGINWKLEQIMNLKTGHNKKDFIKLYKIFLDKIKIEYSGEENHNALFDSFIMWWVLSRHKTLMYT